MNSDIQAVAMLRNEIGAIILGTLFSVMGLISWAIAAIRRRSRVRILFWLGVWTFMPDKHAGPIERDYRSPAGLLGCGSKLPAFSCFF